MLNTRRFYIHTNYTLGMATGKNTAFDTASSRKCPPLHVFCVSFFSRLHEKGFSTYLNCVSFSISRFLCIGKNSALMGVKKHVWRN